MITNHGPTITDHGPTVAFVSDHGTGHCVGNIFWRYFEETSYSKEVATYTIPNGVEIIHQFAFLSCYKIREIIMPNTVRIIEEEAFERCHNLEEVKISENLERIESHAFACCEKLVNVQLPGTLWKIGKYAFLACMSLKNLVLPSGIITIDSDAFCNCTSLETIEFKSDHISMDRGVFNGCSSVKVLKFPSITLNVSYTDGSIGFTEAIKRCMAFLCCHDYSHIFFLLQNGFSFALDLVVQISKKDDEVKQDIIKNADKLLEFASDYGRTDIAAEILNVCGSTMYQNRSMRL